LDRLFLAVMSKAYVEEKLEDGTIRTALNLPAFLAPIKVAVLPLLKKDGLPEKAHEILDLLKFDHACTYDEKDTIGKRYRRQDAIGTPICITIDHQSLEDNTVTIRHRDTMQQDRVSINELVQLVDDKVSFKKALMRLKAKAVSVNS
jgi:glycyl-tRNA synthetase